MSKSNDQFKPGQRVVLTHQIAQRDEVWTTHVIGEILRYEQRKTGSWYAGAKGDKLWLDRLTLRKDDGEIVVCHLDPYTHVQWLVDDASTASDGNAPDVVDNITVDDNHAADAA